MEASPNNENQETPKKPDCPFCKGEVIYPEYKEGCPPEPPKCSKCGKFIPPPGEFHPFLAGMGFDFYNDPKNFGPRNHRRGMSPPRCKNCDTLYPPLEFKSGEPIIMPKCSFCETEMEPPKYLPRCKKCNTLYPFPIYKPGEAPIMPKCPNCQTEMEPPKGPKCQKCGAPIQRLTREERSERMKLYMSGKNPEPRKCKQCGEELKRPNLPFFRGPHRHHGPQGSQGPHGQSGPHGQFGPHGKFGPHGFHHGPHGFHHRRHFGGGMGWRFGWGNWMQNQGFNPKGNNDKDNKQKNTNENQNVYDYYGNNYFKPWFRHHHKKDGNQAKDAPKNENKDTPQAPNASEANNNPNQWQNDPWGMGFGGFGFGWPPFGFRRHHHHGGFGYGHNQQPNQPHGNAPPQNQQNSQPQQVQEQEQDKEGEQIYDMPYYDPYFGYNYQFGNNQGESNNTKKP